MEGAQTLAHATGGRVSRAPAWRVGFYEVALNEEGRDDPVVGVLPDRFEALLTNAYEFEPHGLVFLEPLNFVQDLGHTNFKALRLTQAQSTFNGAYFPSASLKHISTPRSIGPFFFLVAGSIT